MRLLRPSIISAEGQFYANGLALCSGSPFGPGARERLATRL